MIIINAHEGNEKAVLHILKDPRIEVDSSTALRAVLNGLEEATLVLLQNHNVEPNKQILISAVLTNLAGVSTSIIFPKPS